MALENEGRREVIQRRRPVLLRPILLLIVLQHLPELITEQELAIGSGLCRELRKVFCTAVQNGRQRYQVSSCEIAM